MQSLTSACPCQSQSAYQDCCACWHNDQLTPNAEALMRSRYTAYVLGLEQYLLQTWHHSTRPPHLKLNSEPPTKWLGLKILRHEQLNDHQAIVEFIARYKINGKAEKLHEISRFNLEDGHWYYVDGNFIEN